MLALTRKKDESIMIGDTIEVKILEIVGDKVRLGIEAPQNIAIHRQEIYLQIQEENTRASQNILKTLQTLKKFKE